MEWVKNLGQRFLPYMDFVSVGNIYVLKTHLLFHILITKIQIIFQNTQANIRWKYQPLTTDDTDSVLIIAIVTLRFTA